MQDSWRDGGEVRGGGGEEEGRRWGGGGEEEVGRRRGGERGEIVYGGESWNSFHGQSFTLLQHNWAIPICMLLPIRMLLGGPPDIEPTCRSW